MAQPIPRIGEADALGASAPLRVGVIGVGRIGRMHAELLAARVPGVALATVCDVAPDAARAVADQLGVDVAAGVDDVLGAEDVDAVAICSSTPSHADLIARAAAAGKAILCEKPIWNGTPAARSASPISPGSRAATPHRRRSSTPGSPAGCSST